MAKDKGYIDPLLSGFACDYGKTVRKGLAGPELFPLIGVEKPDSKYAYFDKGAWLVPEDRLAENGSEFRSADSSSGKRAINTSEHGLKETLSRRDGYHREGPFVSEEKRAARSLVGKLELARERRILTKAASAAGRSVTLVSGGSEKAAKKWSGNGGDPVKVIEEAKDKLFLDANLMVLSKDTFKVLKFHEGIRACFGDVNKIKMATAEMLKELFEMEKVLIAGGRIAGGNVTPGKEARPDYILKSTLLLAHVAAERDEPGAGASFFVKVQEGAALHGGYVIRKEEVGSTGLYGSVVVYAGYDGVEKVVCPDCIYAIRDCV